MDRLKSRKLWLTVLTNALLAGLGYLAVNDPNPANKEIYGFLIGAITLLGGNYVYQQGKVDRTKLKTEAITEQVKIKEEVAGLLGKKVE